MKLRDFVPPKATVDTAVAARASQARFRREVTPRRNVLGPGRVPVAFTALLAGALTLLAACNSTPPKPQPKPEPKPPELLTGRAAFYKTYIAARAYAADVKPFRIESTASNESNGQDGKRQASIAWPGGARIEENDHEGIRSK